MSFQDIIESSSNAPSWANFKVNRMNKYDFTSEALTGVATTTARQCSLTYINDVLYLTIKNANLLSNALGIKTIPVAYDNVPNVLKSDFNKVYIGYFSAGSVQPADADATTSNLNQYVITAVWEEIIGPAVVPTQLIFYIGKAEQVGLASITDKASSRLGGSNNLRVADAQQITAPFGNLTVMLS